MKICRFVNIFYVLFVFGSLALHAIESPKTMECPGHPRDAEDIQREADEHKYEDKRRQLDALDPDGAPHSTEEAKNLA